MSATTIVRKRPAARKGEVIVKRQRPRPSSTKTAAPVSDADAAYATQRKAILSAAKADGYLTTAMDDAIAQGREFELEGGVLFVALYHNAEAGEFEHEVCWGTQQEFKDVNLGRRMPRGWKMIVVRVPNAQR